MNTQLHHEIIKIETQFKEEESQGVFVSDYEKLYHYNMLYAEAISRYHFLDANRKVIKDRLILEFKRNGDAKTDKMAEAMARTSEEHLKSLENVRVFEKYYLQLRAKIYHLQGKMESDKNNQIAQNVERKYSSASGEGKY